MKIKQVIVIVNRSGRVVLDGSGKCITGNEALLDAEITQATVAVRGTKGETIKVVVDGQGNAASGDGETVKAAMKDFPNTKVGEILGVAPPPPPPPAVPESIGPDDKTPPPVSRRRRSSK